MSKLELNESELKAIASALEKDILKEADLYKDVDIYKETQMYKIKAKAYTKVQSEVFGYEVMINENSIFGMLELKGVN